jgi:UDP-galactopyranose mutase
MKTIKIVGSGFSGAVCAYILGSVGYKIKVFEQRKNIGGNCRDLRRDDGTIQHLYGPHIFHTNDDEVFEFLSQFTTWTQFELRPKGRTHLGLISLPYSLTTISELGFELSQDEIKKYIFKDYSEKQWGIPFQNIPSSITNRIPKTMNKLNPTWFEGQRYQCLPSEGYSSIFEKMLENITVYTNCCNTDWRNEITDYTIYTGKIDEYFQYRFGDLPYRSLELDHRINANPMPHFIENQNTHDVPHTRIYDHGFLTRSTNSTTIITKETPFCAARTDIPFYPIPFGESIELYKKYKFLASREKNVYFLGRLATYKYLDMWMAIKQSINFCKTFLQRQCDKNVKGFDTICQRNAA